MRTPSPTSGWRGRTRGRRGPAPSPLTSATTSRTPSAGCAPSLNRLTASAKYAATCSPAGKGQSRSQAHLRAHRLAKVSQGRRRIYVLTGWQRSVKVAGASTCSPAGKGQSRSQAHLRAHRLAKVSQGRRPIYVLTGWQRSVKVAGPSTCSPAGKGQSRSQAHLNRRYSFQRSFL